jgi:hypothetical protein
MAFAAKIALIAEPPNGLELSRSAGAGKAHLRVSQPGAQGTIRFGPARRVGSSELLGGQDLVA